MATYENILNSYNLYDLDLVKILTSLDEKALKIFEKEFFHGIGSIRDDKGDIKDLVKRWVDIEKDHIDDVFFKKYNIKSSDIENHDLEYFKNIIESAPNSDKNQISYDLDMFKAHYEWLTCGAPFWNNLYDTFNKLGLKINDFVNEDVHLFFDERSPYEKKRQSYLHFLEINLHPLIQHIIENIDKRDVILENIEALKSLNINKIHFITQPLDSLLYDFHIYYHSHEDKYLSLGISDGSYEWFYGYNNFHYKLSNANFVIPMEVFDDSEKAFNGLKYLMSTIIPISENTTITIIKGKYPILNNLVIAPEKLNHLDTIFNAIEIPEQTLEEIDLQIRQLANLGNSIFDQKEETENLSKKGITRLSCCRELSEDNIEELNKKKEDYFATLDAILEEQINATSDNTNIDSESIRKMINPSVSSNPLIPLKKIEEKTSEKPVQKTFTLPKTEN